MVRRFANGALQNTAHDGMFLGPDARKITEGAEHGLVRRQGIFALAAQHLAHAARQNAVLIGDRGDDARDEIVLQIEDRLGSESALIRLRPEMRSGDRVRQLHRQAQFSSCLTQAAFHHIACAELFADGADISRFAGILRCRTRARSRADRKNAKDR